MRDKVKCEWVITLSMHTKTFGLRLLGVHMDLFRLGMVGFWTQTGQLCLSWVGSGFIIISTNLNKNIPNMIGWVGSSGYVLSYKNKFVVKIINGHTKKS